MRQLSVISSELPDDHSTFAIPYWTLLPATRHTTDNPGPVTALAFPPNPAVSSSLAVTRASWLRTQSHSNEPAAR